MKFGFLKIESYRRGIVFSSAFNFISKLLVFFQGVAIAYFFGTQTKTDIFFYCSTTIILAATLINSLDTSVLIPESMRLREHKGQNDSMRFLNSFLYFYLVLGVIVTILFYSMPVNIFLWVSNFSEENLLRNREILLWSIPVFILLILTNLLVNILTSYKYFTIPMIVTAINGILALLFLVLFHDTLNVSSILVGQLIAYLINLAILIYLIKRHLHWNFLLWGGKMERRIFNNIIFAQSGNIASAFSSYVPLYLLSAFPAGIITALNYGQRTAEIPNQLITNQVASVAGIKYNELYAKRDFRYLNEVFLSTSKLLIFILTPISFLIFNFSHDVIEILYKRGAFHENSVQSASDFLKFFILMLPLLAIVGNASRLYMAGQILKYSFYYQILSNIMLAIFIFTGIHYFGIIGFPIASVAINIINVIVIQFYVKKLFPFIQYIELMIYLLKNIGVNIVLLLFIIFMLKIGNFNPMINFIGGSILYVLLLLTFNFFASLNRDINLIVLKCKSYVFR